MQETKKKDTEKYLMLRHLRSVIKLECFLGINRRNLIETSSLTAILMNLYCVIIVFYTTYILSQYDMGSGKARVLFGYTIGSEYILLILTSLFVKRCKVMKMFTNLESFDKQMNIACLKAYNMMMPVTQGYIVILFYLAYVFAEQGIVIFVLFKRQQTLAMVAIVSFSLMTHDLELFFFGALIKLIDVRLRLIQAHVSILFAKKSKKVYSNTFEKLCRNIDMDVTSLHKLYALLHKCGNELNSIMSLPFVLVPSAKLFTTDIKMRAIKAISKPENDMVIPELQKNNFIESKKTSILRHLKVILKIEAFLGIHRRQLLETGLFLSVLLYIYSALLVMFVVYGTTQRKMNSPTQTVFMYTVGTEYILLIFVATFVQKKKMAKFLTNIESFDQKLNVKNLKAYNLMNPIKQGVYMILINISYICVEHAVILAILLGVKIDWAPVIIINLSLLAHDAEIIFFGLLLRAVCVRVRLVKAHVTKLFNHEDCDKYKDNTVEILYKNANADVSTLHTVYALLHKTGEQLNSIMTLPVVIMFLSSGVSTTMLLKNTFRLLQKNESDSVVSRSAIWYSIFRCVKYSIQVVIPCYYSSATTLQVGKIRTILQDAINNCNLEKLERRKVKTFYQLTKENEFAYALWGVIKLDMSLPLSYMGLCTTYLVIVIQFSKFLD